MAGTPDWLLRPHPYLLRALNQTELSKAATRARRIAADHGRPVSHDDVLAQMSLGVWRYLLPSKANKSKQKLWTVAIKNAFPAWPGDWSPESIARVANVHGLRNRVAHLEPLHRYGLRKVRRDMRSVCHAIGPDAALRPDREAAARDRGQPRDPGDVRAEDSCHVSATNRTEST